MPDDEDTGGLPDLREEPPYPVPARYARFLIQAFGGINSVSRATRIEPRNIERFIKGEKIMPWALAKLLWLLLTFRNR